MRNYLFTVALSGLALLPTTAQNLVPNPSFETAASCPSNNIFTAGSWFNPNTASPDYFHPCGSGSTVPPSVLFGPQSARTGTCFAGAGWYGLGGGWYDYIQVQLSTSLTANAVYSISMWVCLADGVTKASDAIGIHVSATPFKSNNTNLPNGYSVVATTPVNFGVFTSLTPQIKCPTGTFITDTNNWTLVSGTYTASGGELAITIGCFEAWASTATQIVNPNGNDRCYYYIDDVAVELAAQAAPSQPLAVFGSTSLCAFATQFFSVAPVSGATSYSWNLPSGWSGTSTSNTINASANSAGGTLSVSAINNIGASTAQTLAITVNNFQASIIQNNGVLQTNITGSYQWVDCNNNYSVIATGNSTYAPVQNGNYAVIINQNGCIDTSACTNLIVLPAQPGTISGNTNACLSNAYTYSIAPVQGATSYAWILPPGFTGASTTNSILVSINAASGTLSVTANNQTGASPMQTINVNATNVLAVLTQSLGTLYANTASSYMWLDCVNNNSVLASGSSSFTPLYTGQFAVVISQNGCSDTSACIAVNLLNTGLAEQQLLSDILLYPNPASQFVTVDVQHAINNSVLIISDALGNEVYQSPVNTTNSTDTKIQISLETFAPGIYFIHLSSNNTQTPYKKLTLIK